MANKAIRYRSYPTTEQEILFAKTFGCGRTVWNLMLSDKVESYKETGKFASVTPAKYKEDYPYLKEVYPERPLLRLMQKTYILQYNDSMSKMLPSLAKAYTLVREIHRNKHNSNVFLTKRKLSRA